MSLTSLVDKSALARAFFAEVTLKYNYWRARYSLFDAVAYPSGNPQQAPREFSPPTFFIRPVAGFEQAPDPSPSTVWEAVETYGDLNLIGPPGAGKTTEFWRLAARSARAQPRPDARLPVLIALGHYDGRASFRDFIRDELERSSRMDLSGETFPAHAQLAAQLEEFLSEGRLLLLFDGLDELPRRAAAESAYRLAVFRDRHRNNRFVISSQQEEHTLWSDLPSVEILELDRQAQVHMLRLAKSGPHPAPPTPDELPAWLPRRPLFLLLYRAVTAQNPHPPATLGALLDDFARQSWRLGCERHPDRGIEYEQAWPPLARLAVAIQSEYGSGTSVPREWALSRLQGDEGQERTIELAWLAREAGLIQEESGGLLRFAHALFQQYFAGLELRRRGVDDPFVKEALRFRHWDEAVVLWGGMERPSRLIRQVLPIDPFLAARIASAGTAVPAGTWNLVHSRLLEKINSPFLTERLQALRALAAAGFPDAAEQVLQRIRSEDAPAQAQLRAILASIPVDALFPTLSPLFKDKDAWWRAWVVALAGELGLRPALVHLVRMSEDADPWVRLEVARALPRLAGAGAISYLGKLLRDSNHLVRQAAAQSMLGFGVQALVVPFSQPRPDGEQAGASQLKTEAVARLIALLKDNIREVRWVASEILSEWPAGQTLPALGSLLRDGSPNIRWLAARVLARRHDHSALPILRTWLSSNDAAERAVAVECLALLQGPAGLADLAPALTDPYWHVRAEAVLALERMHDAAAVPMLLLSLRDADSYVRSLSARVLVDLQAPDAVATLIESLSDENAAVRQSAAQALSRMPSDEAISPLIQLLQDEAREVRSAAAQALGETRQERVASHLVPLLLDEDQGVRASAKKALGKVGGEATLAYLMTAGEEVTPLSLGALRTLYDPDESRPAEGTGWAFDGQFSGSSPGTTPGRPHAFIARFVEQLGHPDPEVRADAEQTLKLHARESHLPLIAPLLTAPDAHLKNAAYDIALAVRHRFNLPKDYSY